MRYSACWGYPPGAVAQVYPVSSDRPLRCEECGMVIAEIRGGCLVIKNKHFGSHHTTVIPIEKLGENTVARAVVADDGLTDNSLMVQ